VPDYFGRVDTTWALSLERLRTEDPAGVQLLELAAFLAPEPIPLSLVGDHAELLDGPLRGTAADSDALADTLGALVGYSLARRSADGFQLHRLVTAVIRHRLASDRQQAPAQQAVALLAAACPGDPDDPATWPGYAQLAPHVLATAPLAHSIPAGRRLVLDTARYLQVHGDSSGSRAVSEQLLERWRSVLGPDHPDTLSAASSLTRALVQLGELEPARALGEDTLQRCRRGLGPDHPITLWAAVVLTLVHIRLGELEPARALSQDVLQRSRRVLGPNHTTRVGAAAVLTYALAQLGEAEPARVLGQDTLQRSRRVLGPDHIVTLGAASALTHALAQLGMAEQAHVLGEDTLQRCRRGLGPDSLITLYLAQAARIAPVPDGDAADDCPSRPR
jgi:hypothetical protein